MPVTPVHSSLLVPEGQVFVANDLGKTVYFVGPLTLWSFQHGGRWPFESRYSRGMIELERERRRRK